MDGSACSILFQHAGGKKENVHYVVAGRVEHAIADINVMRNPSVPILIVDVCPSTEEAADFLVGRGDVTVIDHHKSAERFASKTGFHIDVKNSACGCENFRKWLVKNGELHLDSEPWRRFCAIVDDHDRWQRKIPFAFELPRFLSFVGQKDFVERFFDVPKRFAEEKDDYWTPFEKDVVALIKRRNEIDFRNCKQKMRVLEREWNGEKCKFGYVISDEVNNSEMLMSFLDDHLEIDVACQISFGLQKVSLRSRGGFSGGEFDLVPFVQKYNGGGHSSAAAHPLPDGLIMKIIQEMHQ